MSSTFESVRYVVRWSAVGLPVLVREHPFGKLLNKTGELVSWRPSPWPGRMKELVEVAVALDVVRVVGLRAPEDARPGPVRHPGQVVARVRLGQ